MAARLAPQLNPIGYDIGSLTTLDDTNICGGLEINPPERHGCQRLRRHGNRTDTALRRYAGMRGPASQNNI